MKEIFASFKEKVIRTPTIVSFRFIPGEKVDFLPGQYMEVIFDRDDISLRRFLSFSSSPINEYLEFTKRISGSKFCQRLKELKFGDRILFRLPLGNCVYREEYRKIGFLIGGIGITPVISILEFIMDKKLSTRVFLIYSNRRRNEIAFKEELDSWSKRMDLQIVYTLTEEEPQEGEIKFGPINLELLKQYQSELRGRILFVYGPAGMVESMQELLLELGIKREAIKIEKFLERGGSEI